MTLLVTGTANRWCMLSRWNQLLHLARSLKASKQSIEYHVCRAGLGNTPGPGKYKQHRPFGGPSAFVTRHSTSAFAGGTEARFNPLADVKAARLPGPGAYFVPEQHVKPSFNVTVEQANRFVEADRV